jgi:hypothetical protein
MRKQYLIALEKYDEIEDEDKRDIFKKYVKLKGKLWVEWYNLEEEDERESEENELEGEENEEESEEEDEEEGGEGCGEEGEDQDQGKSEVNNEEQDKNHLINFVLLLESVAREDDKIQIERLWKKQLNLISMLKDSEIDSNDKESEIEDADEDEDTFVRLNKNKNRIKKIIEEFKERGNNYFKHCNKENIKTIGAWFNQLLNDQSRMIKNMNNVKKNMITCMLKYKKVG